MLDLSVLLEKVDLSSDQDRAELSDFLEEIGRLDEAEALRHNGHHVIIHGGHVLYTPDAIIRAIGGEENLEGMGATLVDRWFGGDGWENVLLVNDECAYTHASGDAIFVSRWEYDQRIFDPQRGLIHRNQQHGPWMFSFDEARAGAEAFLATME